MSSDNNAKTVPSYEFKDDFFVAISGIIGAGKSTLATALGKKWGLGVFYESVGENEHLRAFYADMRRHSFALQISLLNQRFAQQQELIWSGRGGIQDRSIYEDRVFATMLRDTGLMEEREYNIYLTLFKNMSNFMKRPSLLVHLDVSPQESLRRIKERNRAMEKDITIEYLTALHKAYEVFIAEISKVIPVVRVNWEEYQDVHLVADKIKASYENLLNVRHI